MRCRKIASSSPLLNSPENRSSQLFIDLAVAGNGFFLRSICPNVLLAAVAQKLLA
jgi:hypothetical protein